MMFFHIDRLGTFPQKKEEQRIPTQNTYNTREAERMFEMLYPNGVNKMGHLYLSPFDIDMSGSGINGTLENHRIFTIEYAFEMVRLLRFPELPSRFQSLFACQAEQDVCDWYNILKENHYDMSRAVVKIIETDDCFVADAAWRDKRLEINGSSEIGKHVKYTVFSPFAYHAWAYDYWSGKPTSNPKIEVLCRLPVSVIGSVPIAEFLC